MNKICWKGRAFKALSYGQNSKKAGRNFSGSITIFHRGGGSKKLLRRIDFQRKNLARGFIERIEYDPNRTARIALVRWSNIKLNDSVDKYAGAPICWADEVQSSKFKARPATVGTKDDYFSSGYSSASYFRRPTVATLSTTLPPNENEGRRSSKRGTFSSGGEGAQRLLRRRSAWSRLNSPPRLLSADGPKAKLSRLLSYSQFEQNVLNPAIHPAAPTGSSTQRTPPSALWRVSARNGPLNFVARPTKFKARSARSRRDEAAQGLAKLKGRQAPPGLICWMAYGPAGPGCSKEDPLGPLGSARSVRIGRQSREPSLPVETLPPFGAVRRFSYILACDELRSGDEVLNIDTGPLGSAEGNLYQKSGISLPLWLAPIGSVIHNIELYPGGGGKLARAAGTSAQLVQKPLTPVAGATTGPERGGPKAFRQIASPSTTPFLARSDSPATRLRQREVRSTEPSPAAEAISTLGGPPSQALRRACKAGNPNGPPIAYATSLCTIRLPSGQQQLLDLRCRATIGCVSNIDHRARMLTKAGQSRWLGFRPVVRGVAMNPIDHPHGGGEGRTKGGRPSVSPWGKPTKRARRVDDRRSRS